MERKKRTKINMSLRIILSRKGGIFILLHSLPLATLGTVDINRVTDSKVLSQRTDSHHFN